MSGTAMRVRLFVNDFQIGGTERQVVALARGLAERRVEVTAGCLRRRGAFLGDLERSGVAVTEYPIPDLYGVRSWAERLRFARDVAGARVDVVHAFGFYPNLFAVPAARLAGVPVVLASVRDMGDLWTPAQRRAQRIVCHLADRVIANSHAVAERLDAEGYDRDAIEIVPNGIDLAAFRERAPDARVRRELGFPADARIVASVSRLNRVRGVEIKGVRYFLQAAAILADGFDDARFLVVGDGPCRPELEAYAARLGLGRKVVFAGYRSDVSRLLSEVSILALPSLTESASNSLLEAMAAGVAVVASRVGGNPEVVENGVNGLLVPPADGAALARAIGRLLHDASLREVLARAGRDRARRSFSLDGAARETGRLYTKLLGATRRGRRRIAAIEPARLAGRAPAGRGPARSSWTR